MISRFFSFISANSYLHSLLSKALIVFLSFLNTIIINRYLGLELRGEYAFTLNYINIISLVLSFALTSSIPNIVSRFGESAGGVVLKLLHVQLVLYLAAAVIFFYSYGFSDLSFFVILCVFTQYSNQLDFYAIFSNVKLRNNILLYSSALYSFSLLILFFVSDSNLIFIFYLLLATVLIKISSYLKFYGLLNSLLSFRVFPRFDYFSIFKLSFFSMLVSLVAMLNYGVDILILESYVSFSELGLYSSAVVFSSLLWLVPDAFKDVLVGKLNKSDGLSLFLSALKLNVLFSFLFFLFFIFSGKFLISFFYGKDYVGSYSSTLILLFGVIPMIFFKFINAYYLSKGKQIFIFMVSFFSVVINVFLNIILIPLFGIDGSALASVVSYFFVGIVLLMFFLKENPTCITSFYKISFLDFKKFL